jgi:hypothetical protein
MLKVLRVNPDSPLIYQNALLGSELRAIFATAPKDPAQVMVSQFQFALTFVDQRKGE